MGNNQSSSTIIRNADPAKEATAPHEANNSEAAPSSLSYETDCFSSVLLLESASATDLEKSLQGTDGLDLDEVSDGEEEPTVGENSTQSLPTATDGKTSIKLKVYSSSDVKIDLVIGEGEFGKVSKATLQGKHKLPVAVRVFRAPFGGKDTIEQLSAVMKLKHRNVVTVLGILDSPNRRSESAYGPRILLHYFPDGNLLQFLSRSNNPQDNATLLKLALDVVQGMEYLHSKNIVHGNLAARNILIEKQRGKMMTHYNAKVTDHGIIQQAVAKRCGKNYLIHKGNILPVRWVPKELLEEDSEGFTFSSDVWSFGITLWEMLTKGSVPYGRRKEEWVIEIIRTGQSPLNIRTPLGYPDQVGYIMKQTFKVNPVERPTFGELRKEFISLSAYIKALGKENKSKLHACNDDQNNPAMKYESEQHASRRGREESKTESCHSSYDRKPIARPSRSTDNVVTRGHTPEKSNFFKKKEENLNSKPLIPIEPLKMTGSKDWRRGVSDSINLSRRMNHRERIPPLMGRRTSAYQKSLEIQHDLSGPNNAHISSFHELSSEPGPFPTPVHPFSMPPPPPPYTRIPLPNHSSAYEGSRGGTRSNSREPPRPKSGGDARLNYAKEIKKKEQELEQLKFQKLKQEASETWDKMQSIVSQITEMKIKVSPPVSLGTGDIGQRDTQHDIRSDRSRTIQQHSVRGGDHSRGRSHSRGRKREDFKLAAGPSANGAQANNVF